MAQWITLLLAALPAIVKIMGYADKWFSKTPLEKATKQLKKQVEGRKVAARKRNQGIKNAKKSYTKDIEDLFNRS